MTERNLTEGALAGHLRQMAVPAALGVVFTTLYNIVDTYYAGWISTDAQAGLTVSFSAFMMMMAVGMGLNMGAGALIGAALGERNTEKARALSAGAIGAAVILALVLMMAGLLWGDGLLRLMQVGDEVFATASSYLFVMFFGLPAFMVGFTANGVLTAQGDTETNKRAQMVASIVNIGLNPLLIYGALGLPGLGFHGIAVSTILIQFGVAIWLVTKALKTKAMRGVSLDQFAPDLALTSQLIRQSAPASLNMMVLMVGGLLIQSHLQPFGAATVAGYGIAFRVEQLILLPILAISIATMPMVAQNFGAGDYDRVRQSLTLASSFALGLSLIGAVFLALGGEAMTRIFTDDPAAVASGAAYLQIAALMMPAYSLMFIINSYFQGVKRPVWSLAIGIYRQFFGIAFFPALFVAYTDWGLTAVWSGLFVAVWSGFAVAFALVFLISRRAIGGMRLDFAGMRAAAT